MTQYIVFKESDGCCARTFLKLMKSFNDLESAKKYILKLETDHFNEDLDEEDHEEITEGKYGFHFKFHKCNNDSGCNHRGETMMTNDYYVFDKAEDAEYDMYRYKIYISDESDDENDDENDDDDENEKNH
jgi:hypothetical protein